MQAAAYDVVYYIYVFIFGSFVSIRIACGRFTPKIWRLFAVICPALLLVQGVALQLCGMEMVWKLYPFIAHLPLILLMVFVLRAKWAASGVSVIISYSMCQLLRWLGLLLEWIGLTQPALLVIHLAACQLILLLLDQVCLEAIHEVLSSSVDVLCCFGIPPVLYYGYEYFMMYTDGRYGDVKALLEMVPTGMVLCFTLFSVAFWREMQKSRRVECQAAALELELSHAQREITSLRAVEKQTAIYRHDLRHHLMVVKSLLEAGGREQADSYISEVQGEMDALVPVRYCENETFNLLLGAFAEKAGEAGVTLSTRVNLPETLDVPDPEWCMLLLNGLENALKAAAALPEGAERAVHVFSDIRQNTLLLEIRNTCADEVVIQDGLPKAKDGEEHYGCRSIQSIVQRRKGICTFEASQGVFTLRIAVPMSRGKKREDR